MTASWCRSVAGPGAGARLQQRDRPGVAPQHLPGRVRPPPHLRAPVAAGRRQLDLAEDEVDDAVEDLVLVGDVVVDRHRLDAELAAASERIVSDAEPAGVGDRDGAAQHPLAAQRRVARRAVARLRCQTSSIRATLAVSYLVR